MIRKEHRTKLTMTANEYDYNADVQCYLKVYANNETDENDSLELLKN